LDTEVVAEARKEHEEKIKTLGELVPVCLELRERGAEYWSKLRHKTLNRGDALSHEVVAVAPGKPLNEITRQMIKDRRDEIVAESGAVSGNRACAGQSTFFAWTIDKQHLPGTNPTADIRPLKETKRDRSLTEDERSMCGSARGDDEYISRSCPGRADFDLAKDALPAGQAPECISYHASSAPGFETQKKHPRASLQSRA
jgi:hypothetical protein